MLTQRIAVVGGEIAVYQDQDGFHAERWDDVAQLIVAQSPDCETAEEAIDAVQ